MGQFYVRVLNSLQEEGSSTDQIVWFGCSLSAKISIQMEISSELFEILAAYCTRT
jgi:hypothetical protein